MGLKPNSKNPIGLFVGLASYCKIIDASWEIRYNKDGYYTVSIFDTERDFVAERKSLKSAVEAVLSLAGQGEGWN